jgi:hypothetical protein
MKTVKCEDSQLSSIHGWSPNLASREPFRFVGYARELRLELSLRGLGCAFAFLGYSHMLTVKPAAELTARALVEALKQTDIEDGGFRKHVFGA